MEKPFKVEFADGMTIVYAKDEGYAKDWAEREFGRTNGPYIASPAEQRDINWCRAMGGRIHNEPKEATPCS